MGKLDQEKASRQVMGRDGQSGYDELPRVGSFQDQARWWKEHRENGERAKRQAVPKPQSNVVNSPVLVTSTKLGNLGGFIDAIEQPAFWSKEIKDTEDILNLVSAKLRKLSGDGSVAEICADPTYLRACLVMEQAYQKLQLRKKAAPKRRRKTRSKGFIR